MHLCAIYAFSFLHAEDIMLHTLVRLNTLRKYAYPLDRIEAATLLRYLSVTAFLTYLPHSRHIISAITGKVGVLEKILHSQSIIPQHFRRTASHAGYAAPHQVRYHSSQHIAQPECVADYVPSSSPR